MSENNGFLENSELFKKGKRGFLSIVFGRSTIVALLLLLQVVLLFLFATVLGERFYLAFGGFTLLAAINMMFILNTDEEPGIKLSWCIIVGIIPAFGILMYWFVRRDMGHRVEKRLMSQVIEESMEYAPEQREMMDELKEEDPHLYNLASYTLKNGGYGAFKNSEVKYYPSGEDKIVDLLESLRGAKSFIFMEYFIINKGSVWDEVLSILIEKAAAGVEVRLIYDGTLAFTALPHDYPEKLEKVGIKCKVFSPISPFITISYNNRDHRKIVVVDGQVAYTGGINLADEYMNRKVTFGYWKDTGVRVTGEAVYGFTYMYLQMWNANERVREYKPWLDFTKECKDAENASDGVVIPYSDSPLDHENVGEMVYLDIINNAKKYVYIMTPYLILDYTMLTALKFAAKRGVDVRIILPHIPDKKYAFALAKTHYKDLTHAGVKLYEFTPGFVHAKEFLSDDARAVVGSINLDYRSLYLHFECAVYMENVDALNDIKDDFGKTLAQCMEVTDETIKHTPILYKVFGKLLKLIAPLM